MSREDVLVKGRRGYVIVDKGNEVIVSFGSPDIIPVQKSDITFIELVDKAGLLKTLQERRESLERRDESDGVDEINYLIGELNSERYRQPMGRLDRYKLLNDLYARMSAMQDDDNWDASLEDGIFIGEIHSGRHDILEAGAQKEIRQCLSKRKRNCRSYEEHGRCMFLFNQQDCKDYNPETW
jgi:hypothetical protein